MSSQYNLILSKNSQQATKQTVEFLVDIAWPKTIQIKNKLIFLMKDKDEATEEFITTKDVFSLCCSQIQKCMLHLFQIFQTEHRNHVLMQESRECTIDRILWCINKLNAVEKNTEKMSRQLENPTPNCDSTDNSINDSLLTSPMYFVDWIDHTLELLTNLSEIVYRTNHNNKPAFDDAWQNEVVSTVSDLHTSIDELLLSAMTLCKCCLPEEQKVLTARCQIVLRETKKLISEIIKEDVEQTYQVTKQSLKLPPKPTNINVLIDVLKDTLYILETNVNNALLVLLIHCLSDFVSPLKELENHFLDSAKDKCICRGVENVEDCLLVKSFDCYNERLMQIGGFSVSCSSDENRTLYLKSGLASLEALDPHLVPAVMLTPNSHHSTFLASAWTQEVRQIRENIFLIVDPVAFLQKAKEIINKDIIKLTKKRLYVNEDVRAIINTGGIVYDFFTTYKKQEPEALDQKDQLVPLLNNLQKVLEECKTVNDFLSTKPEDYMYDTTRKFASKNVTNDQMIKRLKLLFTVVNRVNNLFHKDEEKNENINIFKEIDQENTPPNETKVIRNIKYRNVSRTPFARELSIQKYTPAKGILSKLTRNLKRKSFNTELSFSVQLDELFNDISQHGKNENNFTENVLEINESAKNNASVLYNIRNSKRDSLRKVMMKNKLVGKKTHNALPDASTENRTTDSIEWDVGKSVLDSNTQLQITEILDQLSNLSKMLDAECDDSKKTVIKVNSDSMILPNNQNKLTLSINSEEDSYKNIWSIPIKTPENISSASNVISSSENEHLDSSTVDINNSSIKFIDESILTEPSLLTVKYVNDSKESSMSSSLPSSVTTFERIRDIDLLESRLNELKTSDV